MKRTRQSRRRERVETAAARQATEVAEAIAATVRNEGDDVAGRETAAALTARETR